MTLIQFQQLAVLIGVTAIVCAFFENLCNRQLREAELLRTLLSKHESGWPGTAEIQEGLQVINFECPTHNFHAGRHANFPFRGKIITLVDGQVSGFGSSKHGLAWTTGDRPYVFASREMAAWLQENRDAFKPAWIGERYCIFWVSLKALSA